MSMRATLPSKIIILLCSLIPFGLLFASQHQPIIKTCDLQFGNWTQTYYTDPTPNELPKMINLAIQCKSFDREHEHNIRQGEPNYISPMPYFFAQIFAAHPDKIESWMTQIKFTSDYQEKIIYSALWESNTHVGEKYLTQIASGNTHSAKIAKKIMANPRQNILQKAITPESLDELWASFFATGDAQYIARIISTLSWQSLLISDEPLTKENFYKTVAYLAAKWSLYANAKQDPNIRKKCEEMLPQFDSSIQTMLKQLLTENEREYRQNRASDEARISTLVDKYVALHPKKH